MGYPPFQGATEAELLDQTVNHPVQYIAEDWAELSSDALLLVKNMLAKNPEQRPSMEEVLAFDWVKHPPKVRDQRREMSRRNATRYRLRDLVAIF